jgi:hypothetical protein
LISLSALKENDGQKRLVLVLLVNKKKFWRFRARNYEEQSQQIEYDRQTNEQKKIAAKNVLQTADDTE